MAWGTHKPGSEHHDRYPNGCFRVSVTAEHSLAEDLGISVEAHEHSVVLSLCGFNPGERIRRDVGCYFGVEDDVEFPEPAGEAGDLNATATCDDCETPLRLSNPKHRGDAGDARGECQNCGAEYVVGFEVTGKTKMGSE